VHLQVEPRESQQRVLAEPAAAIGLGRRHARERGARGQQAVERGHAHIKIERHRHGGAKLLGEKIEHLAHVDGRSLFVFLLPICRPFRILILRQGGEVGDALEIFREEEERRGQQLRLDRRHARPLTARRYVIHEGSPRAHRHWPAPLSKLVLLRKMGTPMNGDLRGSVKALVFDVFGTVVDWRSSVIRELESLARAKGLALDCAAFADDWRGGYQPAMQRVRSGELPWTRIDDLHRMILDELLAKYRITGLTDAEKDHLNHAWHRLTPWPEAVEGLTRLKRRFIIGTLSNGNTALLVNLAKRAGLPWDVVLSAELVRHYKPDPEAYRMPCDLLGLAPGEVMLVAAHPNDLAAAARQGLKTGYVPRPLEWGPNRKPHDVQGKRFDVVADDFNHLAELMGA
jgi:2-haloacid dehalogenase